MYTDGGRPLLTAAKRSWLIAVLLALVAMLLLALAQGLTAGAAS